MKSRTMQTDSGFTLGPIPIPRARQVKNDLYRFFSIKAGMRIVCCESRLEAFRIYEAEADTSVVWLCEQALRIDRPIGKKPWYTFDLATRDNAGEEWLEEIKAARHLVPTADGKPKPKDWEAIEAATAEIGKRCRFRTDLDLQVNITLINNWRRLLPFARRAYEDPQNDLLAQLKHIASGGYGISIRDACGSEPARKRDEILAHIAMLLHCGELVAPLDKERVTPALRLRATANE